MPTPIKPLPPPQIATAVDPTTEYVSGGGVSWLAQYLATLPPFIDDVTRDFGDDLYERMMRDPQIASSINTIKHGILATGVSLPAVKLPTTQKDEADGVTTTAPHADQPKADEIAAFCQRLLDNLKTPLHDVLWNMLDALAFGHKIAEKVYGDGIGEDAGKLVLTKLKVKPRRTTAFVVDAFSNVAGLLALIPGVSYTVMTQNLFGPGASLQNFIPREKFAVLTCRETDSDPRGVSLLRPAYYAWYAKTQVWPAYLKFLALYAIGILVGTTAEQNVGDSLAYQADGVTPLQDTLGNLVYLSSQQAMLQNLIALEGGTAIALPFGATLDTLKPAGDGSVFGAANDLFNREIEKAITGQTLATSEAKHDTRAASQTHQDVLGGVMGYGRSLVETMLYRDVLLPTVLINYGEDAAALVPHPVLSDVEQQDTVALWGAVGALNTSGYLDASQKIALDAQVGLPERSVNSVAKEVERQNAPPATPAAPPVAPTAPGDKPEDSLPQ